MITSKEVFAKRKEGALDEAYQMAVQLMENPQPDDWDVKAFGWCLIDLIKRDVKTEAKNNLPYYRQQLESITVDTSDKILSENRARAIKMCSPSGALIAQAKEISKAGRHLEAANLYRHILSGGDQSQDIQTSLAWELYRLSKAMLNQDPPNLMGVKRHLSDYLKLLMEKPSVLHSLFLRLADKLAMEEKLNLGAFVKFWGLENLSSDDYSPFTSEEGDVYPSLAEKVILHASKDAAKRDVKEDLNYILPFLDMMVEKCRDNIWLRLNKAKVLLALGRTEEALPLGLEVVKSKVNDYWAWELLGDTHKNSNLEYTMACYCKALLCSSDINFTGKVKVKLAEILIQKNELAHAKFEVQALVDYRTSQSQKVPPLVESIMNQPWYSVTESVSSNRDFYILHSPKAETLLFSDLPWVDGVLGQTFTIEGRSDKPKRKIFIASSPTPFEVTVAASKALLDGLIPGDAISVKGEYDQDKRYQIYTIVPREAVSKWDIFSDHVGVVDHVNKSKELIHFMVDRKVDGIINFSELNASFNEGDSISVRLSKYTTKQGSRYHVLSASSTDQAPSESILKNFKENVIAENGMGFTDYDIFIPPPLMDKHKVENGNVVSGIAILNYNKKRGQWGWKALSIEEVLP
jgi:tetratricopeptide (TPR) repeat protein